MFLTSVKPALKFGTMRTLSEVAAKYPMSILKCNADMEMLISDPNRCGCLRLPGAEMS